jgi:hypothetical protein
MAQGCESPLGNPQTESVLTPFCSMAKHSRASSTIFSNRNILQHVLRFVGAGEYIFAAPISKLWLFYYKQQAAYKLKAFETCSKQDFAVVPQMTTRRATLVSVARLRLAHMCGLRFNADSTELQFETGRLASIVVLAEAHRLGMQFTSHVADGAAASSDLSKLEWLHREHKCPLGISTSIQACVNSDIPMLQWLQQQGVKLDQKLLFCAPMQSRLVMSEFLYMNAAPGTGWLLV